MEDWQKEIKKGMSHAQVMAVIEKNKTAIPKKWEFEKEKSKKKSKIESQPEEQVEDAEAQETL